MLTLAVPPSPPRIAQPYGHLRLPSYLGGSAFSIVSRGFDDPPQLAAMATSVKQPPVVWWEAPQNRRCFPICSSWVGKRWKLQKV